ncbi:MAG: pitrilysin family protein [Acidobacteriota bacterium]
MSDTVRKQVLANGLTVLTEEMKAFRSVCLGVWLRRGSRDETDVQNGITHFIEHLVFKGTQTRSAREIAKLLDRFGGQTDASTGHEQTCFWAKVMDRHMGDALDLLSDIVLRPRFDPREIERERNVIFEEIRMVEDSPEDLVYDLFTDALWGDHPLGRPIQGTHESVGAMTREAILEYFRAAYVSGNLILSAAGNLSHEELVARVEAAFRDLPGGNGSVPLAPPAIGSRVLLRERELEQLQVCLGVPGFPVSDSRRHAGRVLNTILGGNMSSRLFQAVREERGLAYSVYSSAHGYLDTGYFMVYLATAPGQVREALDVVQAEIRRLCREAVSPAELQEAKEHLTGGLMLGLESSSNRMGHLAQQEIYFGRQVDADRMLREIEGVTLEDVRTLAVELFDGREASLAALGRVGASGLTEAPLRLG